nr:hypothetical protein [Methylomarinum sp. Ch1-1]MDP4523271.1 hypothetical protein [Methylomarinum sp. Ch1-1]
MIRPEKEKADRLLKIINFLNDHSTLLISEERLAHKLGLDVSQLSFDLAELLSTQSIKHDHFKKPEAHDWIMHYLDEAIEKTGEKKIHRTTSIY